MLEIGDRPVEVCNNSELVIHQVITVDIFSIEISYDNILFVRSESRLKYTFIFYVQVSRYVFNFFQSAGINVEGLNSKLI